MSMAAAEPSSRVMASPRLEGLREGLRHILSAFPDVDAALGRNDFAGARKLLAPRSTRPPITALPISASVSPWRRRASQYLLPAERCRKGRPAQGIA